MNPIAKKILISFLIIGMFALLIWFSLKIAERMAGEPEAGTNTNYYNFSKDVSEELAKKEGLSVGGQITKQELLAPLNGEAGILFENTEFQIEYYPPLKNLSERYVVTINSRDFEQTKEAVRQWFINKGFSEQDVCNLPIAFYPSTDVITSYGEDATPVFDPTLTNCNE